MLIPKNTTVFLPVWAVHHTDDIYNDAETFNPDRYAGKSRLANDYAGSPDFENRDHYGYGAGRRICPGIHLAERNMWRIAAKLLWAFEFLPATDETTGKPIPIDTEAYTPGIAQFPMPFAVDIRCRSDRHKSQIIRELNDAMALLEQFS
jgi:cytochrome P450